jgi:hypothetical protein
LNVPNALWDKTLPLSQTTVPKLPNRYRNFGPVLGFGSVVYVLYRYSQLTSKDRLFARYIFQQNVTTNQVQLLACALLI